MLSVLTFTILAVLGQCGAQMDLLLVYQNHLTIINSALSNEEISQDCVQQLGLYYNGLQNQESWALMMFDAKGKIPSGIGSGNLFELGNYDQCLGITSGNITGKYCLGTIPIPIDDLGTRMIASDVSTAGFHIASCLPSKCSADDLCKIYSLQEFEEKYCYSKETEPKLTAGPITAIVILSIFGLLVVLSTCYDVYIYYSGYQPGTNLATALSYFTNGKKLLSSSRNPDQLLCLNGMKAISMMWILMGHEYMHTISGPISNNMDLFQIRRERANMFVMGSTVSVDTFLAIGALVTVYTFLKACEKGVKFNIFLYYIHRYIRLTPALAVVVMVHATLLKHFANGPFWNGFDDSLVEPCQKYWWSALLYIQNYVNNSDICVPQSWYLSIDMQLFILSPLVLLPLKLRPKWTLYGLGALIIAGIIIPFGVGFGEKLNAYAMTGAGDATKYMSVYYSQTYARFGPYVMGMILGYFIYKIKKDNIKITLKWFQVLFLWGVFLAGGLACVYAHHDAVFADYNRWSHSLFIAFNRPAFTLAICGMIFLCLTGYGGPINAFLSASVFQFISKLSYSLYLVHYALIYLRVMSYKTTFMIEHFYLFFNYWGDFMFSLALSVVLCLTFESPMITIEKLMLSGGLSKRKQETQINECKA